MPGSVLHLLAAGTPSAELSRLLGWRAENPAIGRQTVVFLAGDQAAHCPLVDAGFDCFTLSARTFDPLRPLKLARLLRALRPARIAFWNIPDSWVSTVCRLAAPRSEWWASWTKASLPDPSLASRLWKPLRVAWVETEEMLNTCQARYAGKLNCSWRVWSAAPAVTLTATPDIPTCDTLLRDFDLPTDAIVMTAVGPWRRDKRGDELFWSLEQAGHAVPNLYLLMCGMGPDIARLKQYAKLYGIEHRVRWLTERPDWKRLAAATDLYVSADTRAKVPLALSEALAAGLSALVPDRPWLRRALAAGHGATYNDHFPAELSRAIVHWYKQRNSDQEQSPVFVDQKPAWRSLCQLLTAEMMIGSDNHALTGPHPNTRSAADSPL